MSGVLSSYGIPSGPCHESSVESRLSQSPVCGASGAGGKSDRASLLSPPSAIASGVARGCCSEAMDTRKKGEHDYRSLSSLDSGGHVRAVA